MTTPFELLSRMIQVRELAKPLFDSFEVSAATADVWERWSERCSLRAESPMEQIALATENGHVVGWLGFDMLDGETIGECIEKILPETIITADTPALEAAKEFARTKHPFFLTLEMNKLSGWLSYDGFFRLPFRLCLFSLLLGIEQLASDLSKTRCNASLAALNPSRIEKIRITYKLRDFGYDREGNEFPANLLDCTTFADKIKILRRVFSQDVPVCKSSFFDLAESIRNDLAHPRDEDEIASKLPREKLLPFIEWSESIQVQMKNALQIRLD